MKCKVGRLNSYIKNWHPRHIQVSIIMIHLFEETCVFLQLVILKKLILIVNKLFILFLTMRSHLHLIIFFCPFQHEYTTFICFEISFYFVSFLYDDCRLFIILKRANLFSWLLTHQLERQQLLNMHLLQHRKYARIFYCWFNGFISLSLSHTHTQRNILNLLIN